MPPMTMARDALISAMSLMVRNEPPWSRCEASLSCAPPALATRSCLPQRLPGRFAHTFVWVAE